MSDLHSNQGSSLERTNRQEIESDVQKVDADCATSTSVYHPQHQHHDSRYWHTACRVRDCKLGFPECKVGSSCCKAGWKNALEEPLCRSRSLAMASKRPELLTMLPSLLSDLTISRTHSDPCIFGKDFLRITLPLPGEPRDCGAKVHAVQNSEYRLFENMNEPLNSVGSGTGEESPVLEAFTPPFTLKCKTKINANSVNNTLFCVQNSAAPLQNDDESIHNVTQPKINCIEEHRIQCPDNVSLRNNMEFSLSFGAIPSEKTMGNLVGTFDKNAAANNPMQEANNSFGSSRTPQWNSWLACQSNECSQRHEYSGQISMQYGTKSTVHNLTFSGETEMDQAEEEGLDEGYLVLEEHEDQQHGRFEDEVDACDDAEEENLFCAEQEITNDLEEEHFKGGEINTDSGSKGYKEDDIWSDEHFVTSQVKGFPPPISILANETHPGLPGHMPRTLWRSVKRDGRFVLQEVQAQPREFFRATRECGRLRLQLVRPDSDPVGSYTEIVDMSNQVSAGVVSLPSPNNIENLSGILDTVKSEDYQIVLKGGVSRTYTEGFNVPQPMECWTSEIGANLGAALDKDDSKTVEGVTSSIFSLKECGSAIEETPGPCFGQTCTKMNAGLTEVPDSTGRDGSIEVSCVTKHSQISEESWEGKMALNEMLSETTHHLTTQESFPDSGKDEVGRVSEVSRVDNREKPVGFCSSDVQVHEVGTPLDTGVKLTGGQIDGEQKLERRGVLKLCTKLDVGQVEKVEDLGMGNHSTVVLPPSVHGHEEQFMQDYQHPCFNPTYGFDNNLKVLSPSQAFMQFPIQPAVR